MWIQLTSEALLSRVSSSEQSRLNRSAVSSTQSDVLGEIAGQLAKEWRSGLRRVTNVDIRADYIPDELLIHILADFRYRAYTRLPGMGELLDALRVDEWHRANTVRDSLSKVSIEAPEAEYTEAVGISGTPDPIFTVPESVLETEYL